MKINSNSPNDACGNPLVTKEVFSSILKEEKENFQTIPLKKYLEKRLKPRGSGQGTLNSHKEQVLTSHFKKEDLLESSNPIALLTWGNKYQMIIGTVQGYNPNDPESGFERPVLEEGPHMVIGLYSLDSKGDLHLFRTIQIRNNRVLLDTPRGFATQKILENGEQIYNLEPDQIIINLNEIMAKETGKLVIESITFLGADISNSSCIISQSALFAVKINHDKFLDFSKLITSEESQRRSQQFKHEGLIGGIIDMSTKDYLAYKNNPKIIKDMTADKISDLILINFLSNPKEIF